MIDPEVVGQKYEKYIKYALYSLVGIGFLAVTVNFITAAVTSLAYWGVLLGSAYVFYTFAPIIAIWFANKKIQALKAIAAANPIETMQNLYREKKIEFQKQEEAVTEFETQFSNVRDLVAGLKKTDPEEAVQYAEMADKMEEGLKELRGEQRFAQQELNNAEKAIGKMQRIWNVALAMNKALTASASAQQKVYDQISQDVAVETVRTNLNRAFAKLSTAVERRKNGSMFVDAPKELPPAQKVEVIDITSNRVLSKVPR